MPNDRIALDTLADVFPDREVVGIYSGDLIWGFGAMHCMTQQQPRHLAFSTQPSAFSQVGLWEQLSRGAHGLSAELLLSHFLYCVGWGPFSSISRFQMAPSRV